MTSEERIALTREQVREVDRRAIEAYGVPGIVLMENAARNAAGRILAFMSALDRGAARAEARGSSNLCGAVGHRMAARAESRGSSAIVCGRGNNGGDGFAIARHLHNAGAEVVLFLACDPARLAGDAATNFHVVRKMSLPCHRLDTPDAVASARPLLSRAAVIVDAILGTGFSAGQVRPPLDAVIEAINAADSAKVVAIDVPSGLDCDTGRPSNATVRADLTITFVARKVGFAAAEEYTGDVHVADIGAPASIIQEVLSAAGSG